MDKLTQKRWEETLEKLSDCSKEKRDHFAMLVLQLADCYDDDMSSKAVVLLHKNDVLAMFSAGANTMDAAEIVSKAHEALMATVTADAPPKEMLN
jgi:hypothetical protein